MRHVLLGLLAAALLSASGCASMGPTTTASDDECNRIDCDKVARVNHTARMRGIDVKWVNMPHKRTTAAGS